MGYMADEEMRPAHLAFMASCAGHISSETLCSISRKETKTKNCEHKKRKNEEEYSLRRFIENSALLATVTPSIDT
jgi:hypothetical protein